MGMKFVGLEQARGDVKKLQLRFKGTLDDEELSRGLGCVGYAFARLRGEKFSEPFNVRRVYGETIAQVYWDSTTVQRTDPWEVFQLELIDDANDYVENGTPIRDTDRQGPGTKGTRLVEGINTTVRIEAEVPEEIKLRLDLYDVDGDYIRSVHLTVDTPVESVVINND